MTGPTHLRLAELDVVPWRNGAGTTTTLATGRWGAAGMDLRTGRAAESTSVDVDLRVSLARLLRPAPFSSFPGLTRIFTLIEGGPVDLAIAGRARAVVRLEPLHFEGEATVDLLRIDGPARALNVFARRTTTTADVLVMPNEPVPGGAVEVGSISTSPSAGGDSWWTTALGGIPGGATRPGPYARIIVRATGSTSGSS